MSKYAFLLLVLLNCHFKQIYARWDEEISCPVSCACRLEHLSDMAIYRYTKEPAQGTDLLYEEYQQNNEALYDDDLKVTYEGNPLLKAITCLLQTHVEPKSLIEKLPYDVEYLSIIQGYNAGNKTIKFSDLQSLSDLLILEFQGSKSENASLVCDIDSSLITLKYLNLDHVLLRSTKQKQKTYNSIISDDDNLDPFPTFEFVQQLDSNSHPLKMVSKRVRDDILPYRKFKELRTDNDIPVFMGFNNLLFLRVFNCELFNVYWEMFEGLSNLQYLMLEKNNLKFIPDFAFYGTPNLRILSLAHNNLLSIQITDLAGLLDLEYLDLSYNNFSQLSELSFPPFPKLQLADFGNNPINVVFPNTFDVMNTTDSLVLGGQDTPLSLLSNSFLGLNMLKKLILKNLHVNKLKRDLLVGMPRLIELHINGNVPEIEFDTFLDTTNIEKLVLSHCNISNVSMDSFIGLENLKYLDLSHNLLEYLPPGIFDQLHKLTELLLNNNRFSNLERGILSKVTAKLIRLTDNPWHCSCAMSDWKPMIINKRKQKTIAACEYSLDKGVNCQPESKIQYVYDNRVAPRCSTPNKFKNWSVFHVMRKQFKCPKYRPKVKKIKVPLEKKIEYLKQVQSFPYVDKLAYSKMKLSETNQKNNLDSLKAAKETKTPKGTMNSVQNVVPSDVSQQSDNDISTDDKSILSNNEEPSSNLYPVIMNNAETLMENTAEYQFQLPKINKPENNNVIPVLYPENNRTEKLTASAQYKLQLAKLNKWRRKYKKQ